MDRYTAFYNLPNDVDLNKSIQAIFVGGAGDIVMTAWSGDEKTFTVLAGTIYPISPKQIATSGTTATGLVGLG